MGVLASLLKIRNSGKTGSTFPLGDPQLELVRAVLASEAWWRPSLMGTWYPWLPISSQSAAFVNLAIAPPTHASTFPSTSVEAFTFSTLGRSQRERRGQFYLGLGKRLGRGGELRAEPGKINMYSPRGNKGRRGGRKKAAWTSKQPKQKQGREEQPHLGLPVLLSLALAALMGVLTQDSPNSVSDLLGPASDWREQGDR